MKRKNRFFVKGFYMMIAVMTMFLVGAADKADAASASVLIPVAEFTTDGGTWTAPGDFFKSFAGGYLSGGDSGSCLVAPVKIPGNATKINKLIVYLTDDGTGAFHPLFQLTAIDMTTAFAEDYVNSEVADGSDTIQAIEVPLLKQKVVKGRVYQLGTCLYGGQYLYGAKVLYTVP
jgi:hypothetical protein